MKQGFTFGLLILTGAAVTVTPAVADIVAKEFILPGTGKIESGFVLQGSRNMKRLGKGGTTSTITVQPFSPLSPSPVATVIPALETPEITPKPPKPRFGYGSDYVPGAELSGDSALQVPTLPPFTPIYQQPDRSLSYWSLRSPWYFYPGATYFFQPSLSHPCHSSYSFHGGFFSGSALSFSRGSPFFGCP